MKIVQNFRSVLAEQKGVGFIRLAQQLLIILLLCCGFLAKAQDPPQYGTPFNGVPDPRDVNMYQAHLRIFSPGDDFQSVTNRMDQIEDLGINVLYLMPIFPHGTDAQSSPSPYCIKDFKAVASEYGDLNSLRQLVDAAHARGIAVILDIAINGTSWDHLWRTTNPEYYTGSQLGPFADIAELDLNSSATRAAIIDAMRYWIFAANIDGYRCDFANNPSIGFWSEVIGNLRSINSHDLLMFAEGDRLENFQAGFDLNFGDKWFYDALEDVSQLNASVSSRFSDVNNVEYTYANSVQQVVRYTGNHDSYTNPFNGVDGGARPFLMFNNHDGTVANFLVSAYMKGVPFLMSGQEVDYNQWTPWPWTDPGLDINWSQNQLSIQDFSDILNFRKNSTAIRRGSLNNYSSNDVCAFTKTSGSEEVVVIVNMRNNSVNYTIPSAMGGSYTNAFTGANVNLTGGSNQSLGAYQYLVLTSSGCSSTPIQPNISVNGGSWQQVTSVTVTAGDDVTIGPQPLDGSWSWTGPNGYSSTSRQQTFNNIQTSQSGTYTATYTNPCGAPSNLGFNIMVNSTGAQNPYSGSPVSIPGTIEFENFDTGGEGVSYHDNDASNNGGQYRTSGVDIEACSEGGFNIGWTGSGEWVEYTVDVSSSGNYDFDIRVAGDVGGNFRIEFGGADVTGTVNVPNTGGWQAWQTVTVSGVALSAGQQVMRLYMNTGGFNLNNVTISAASGGGGGTAYRIRNRWQNTYLYDSGDQALYGTPSSSDTNSHWELESVDGHTVIQNVGTGDYLNIENQLSYVECTDVPTSYWSAQWALEDYDGHTRIRNRWQSSEYIHVENLAGYAEHGVSQAGWHSNHWVLETVSSSRLGEEVEPKPRIEPVLYPNPFGSEINLRMGNLDKDSEFTLSIWDITGRKVLTKKVTSDSEGQLADKISTDALNPGIYHIRLETPTGMKVFKMIKK